jgi:beta-glucosidase
VTEGEIDRALARLFAVRFRLGLLDPARASSGDAPRSLAVISELDAIGSPSHVALAREAARKSLVLLRNDGALPIAAGVRRIAVVGPLADDVDVLLGNYHGDPGAPVTVLHGIRAAAAVRGIAVEHVAGVGLAGRSAAGLVQAVAAARAADLIIAVLGLSPLLEGEQGDPDGANPAGDRQDLGLPGAQPALLEALLRTGKPTVVVLTGGGVVTLPDHGRPPNALLMAWYPGEQGGNAVADVLFGDVSPSGRLPITFYRSVTDLPPFADYGMAGRTYRYFKGKPLFPFGFGLGYADVATREVTVGAGPAAAGTAFGDAVVVHATVENRGTRAVEEVLQVYATSRERLAGDPVRSLVAFRRVALAVGQTQSVTFDLSQRTFARVGQDGVRRPLGGNWDLTIGGITATLELPR